MRLIGGASLIVILATVLAVSGIRSRAQTGAVTDAVSAQANSNAGRHEGKTIFRYDTFGDEQLWTDVLRMNEAISTMSPATALGVGLKVDVAALPPSIIKALRTEADRSRRPGGDRGAAGPECGPVGVKGTVDEGGQAHASRRDVCAMPFVGRQLVCVGHRQPARRMGQYRSQRRRDCGAVARAG